MTEFTTLPHTLSFHTPAVDTPLTGLPEDIFQDVQSGDTLETLLFRLMRSMPSEEIARRLVSRKDGFPLPQQLEAEPWKEKVDLPELDSLEMRTYRVFRQLVMDERKSTRYFEAFAELLKKYPDAEPLNYLIFAYRLLWEKDKEPVISALRQCLENHSGWMHLRLLLARYAMDENNPEAFLEAMDQRINLHEHLEQMTSSLTDILTYQFHIDVYIFCCLTARPFRAAYCFSRCCEVSSDDNFMQPLASFVLANQDVQTGVQVMQDLAHFLQP